MTDRLKPAVELEAEARAINASDWQPLPGMAKKRYSRCSYWFAVPEAETETTSRCPDCASVGSRLLTRARCAKSG